MSNGVVIHANKQPWSRCVELLVKADSGRNAYVKQVVLEEVEPGSWIEPTFSLSDVAAQSLMDELWNCGLRPTNGSGSAGALSATEKHLDDMRRLVFKDDA